MPTNAGYKGAFKAGKGNGEKNLSGAKALVQALAKKGIKAQAGLETKPLVTMTYGGAGGGADMVDMLIQGSGKSMMEAGGEKYNYGRGGSYGQASTYSGKKKKKRKK